MTPSIRLENIMSTGAVPQRRRILVDGPLAPFTDGLRRGLVRRGYAADTINEHVHLLADLSSWLCTQGLGASELTDEVHQEFLQARRASGWRFGVTGRAFAPILGYLRELGVTPPSTVAIPATPLDRLLFEYCRYLEDERG